MSSEGHLLNEKAYKGDPVATQNGRSPTVVLPSVGIPACV